MSLKYLDSLDLSKILGSFLAIPVSFGGIYPYLGMVLATRTRVLYNYRELDYIAFNIYCMVYQAAFRPKLMFYGRKKSLDKPINRDIKNHSLNSEDVTNTRRQDNDLN